MQIHSSRMSSFGKIIGVVLAGWAISAGVRAQAQQPAIVANIDTSRVDAPISKYLYGGFIEHGGALMYRSLWAEMIDDRKFYFPMNSRDALPATPAPTNAMRAPLRKWHPVGPDDAIVLDTAEAFVGSQSPRVELSADTPHGISQSGFALIRDKQYVGRIYLRGTAGAKVKVSLIWGNGPNDRQTISFNALTNTYRKYPLAFQSKADAPSGTIEITGTGSGNFHVGTLSLMPADNVQGFRPDTIALLRDLHAGMWRLPGGNFISDWDWHNSIGDIDKRTPVFDYAWNAMQTNDLGMDELMTLCKLIDVDPYITVNAGLGDAHSAAEEVEYMNGPASTRLGAERAKNGHPEPYHVKYWDIGNEPYGSWQYGHTDIKYYAVKHNDFAQAMRAVDPSITLLASGAMPDEMTVEGQPRTIGIPDPQVHFGDPQMDWTGGLLLHSFGNFDGLTEHWYVRAGKRFDYDHAKSLPMNSPIEGGYVNVDETVLEFARHPSNRVHKKAEEWNEYVKRFPAMREKNIFLSIDEYGYGGSSMKSVLATGMIMNEMFRHTDFMKMAAYTMSVSTIDYNATAAVYNARGLLYKTYKEHLGTLPVAVSGDSPQPAPKYPPYGDQPAESAGSATYPLDMVAALTEDRKYLTLSVVNATESAQKLNINVNGEHLAGPSAVWQMTGSSLDADNRVGQPAQVEVKEIPIGDPSQPLSVAPYSVNVYRFPVH
ncbi:MAG TPA: alpha-L-arabinofuranosidase C-terminal domain-containing protein [Acidobacteriaceae bacterium]